MFEKLNFYAFAVDELRGFFSSESQNSEKGTLVFDVNATDADIAENGQVHYVIMHGAEGKFVINSTTGVIETAGDLDRETKDLYTVNCVHVRISN